MDEAELHSDCVDIACSCGAHGLHIVTDYAPVYVEMYHRRYPRPFARLRRAWSIWRHGPVLCLDEPDVRSLIAALAGAPRAAVSEPTWTSTSRESA